MKLNLNVTGYISLRIGQKCFDVTHDRIQVLTFMQPVTIELGKLIFPAQLPFGEHVFFKRVMSFQDQHGCSGFESNPTFNTNDGIADMNISSNAVSARYTL